MRTPQTHHRFVATPIALENSNSIRPVGLDDDENVRVDNSTHVENRTCHPTDASPIARYQVPQLRTLLVPLDGSPFAERALPLAAQLACRAGAELRIVHVDSTCGSHARDDSVGDITVYIYCAELEWHKRAYLEETAKRLRHEFSVRVTPILLNNHEVTQALFEAVDSDVDLVVMAAHGKGMIRRWVSGSTLHDMIRKLRVPLLVVGADGSFAAPAPHRVRRILIALDGSPGAEQAIGPAMALGGLADTEIMLLRVVPLSTAFGALSYRGGSGEPHDGPKRMVLSMAHRYLRRVAGRMEQQSCIVDSRIVLGHTSIARCIAAQAQSYDADMIAIASQKDEQRKWSWRGSIAERVVQFASVPVLIATP
jgi:nucleotide-binding universal stress UspA family protein